MTTDLLNLVIVKLEDERSTTTVCNMCKIKHNTDNNNNQRRRRHHKCKCLINNLCKVLLLLRDVSVISMLFV